MRPSALLLAVAATALGLGCVTTSPPDPTSFWFEHDGARYAIVSSGTDVEPANDLLRVEREGVALHGRDRDQDGVLDTVLVGSLPLADADAIYRRGIEVAAARGVARTRDLARTFELRERSGRLVLTSVARGGSDWVNELVRYGPTDDPSPTWTDSDADGRLDDGAPESAHLDYARVLAAGIEAGRIERVGERFRVGVRPG